MAQIIYASGFLPTALHGTSAKGLHFSAVDQALSVFLQLLWRELKFSIDLYLYLDSCTDIICLGLSIVFQKAATKFGFVTTPSAATLCDNSSNFQH